MSQLLRLVLDTNVLVSASLRFGSTPWQAFVKAREEAVLLASDETLAEFREVLLRDKFDRMVDRSLREGLIQEYADQCTIIPIPSPIRACRDPRDDKFLAVAVHGGADAILTGDVDLLALHPFQGVGILTPAAYLEMV